jgi:hypothetical protein
MGKTTPRSAGKARELIDFPEFKNETSGTVLNVKEVKQGAEVSQILDGMKSFVSCFPANEEYELTLCLKKIPKVDNVSVEE